MFATVFWRSAFNLTSSIRIARAITNRQLSHSIRFCKPQNMKLKQEVTDIIHSYDESEVDFDQLFNDNKEYVEPAPVIFDPDFYNQLDHQMQQRLEAIKKEYETLQYVFMFVPSNPLKTEDWKILLGYRTPLARLKYLQYLYKVEHDQLKEMTRKTIANELRAKRLAEMTDEEREAYENCTVQRHNINRYYHVEDNKLLWPMITGDLPHIVYDFEFQNLASEKGVSMAARQMNLVYGDNRVHPYAARIDFINVPYRGERTWYDRMRVRNLNFLEPERFTRTNGEEVPFWYNVYREDLLDLYAKNKLVYLTPDAKEMLTEVDADHIYVIGVIVKSPPGAHTEAKAHRLGIKSKRLPTRNYPHFRGRLDININHVHNILCDVYGGKSWFDAFDQRLPFRQKEAITEKQILSRMHRQMSSQRNRKYFEDTLLHLEPVPGDCGSYQQNKREIRRYNRKNMQHKINEYDPDWGLIGNSSSNSNNDKQIWQNTSKEVREQRGEYSSKNTFNHRKRDDFY